MCKGWDKDPGAAGPGGPREGSPSRECLAVLIALWAEQLMRGLCRVGGRGNAGGILERGVIYHPSWENRGPPGEIVEMQKKEGVGRGTQGWKGKI